MRLICMLTDIMTVTVAHSESKMSLFQEMKLKRRKADSRCSSDGNHSFIHSFIITNQIIFNSITKKNHLKTFK